MLELEISVRDAQSIDDIRACLGEYLGLFLDNQSRKRKDAVRIVSVADENGETQIPVSDWFMDPISFDERLEWVRDVFIVQEKYSAVFEIMDKGKARYATLSLDYKRACYIISAESRDDEDLIFWRFTSPWTARLYDDYLYGALDRTFHPSLAGDHIRVFRFGKIYYEGQVFDTPGEYKLDRNRRKLPFRGFFPDPRVDFYKRSGYDYSVLMKGSEGWERWHVLWRREGVIDDSGLVAVSRMSPDGSVVERDLVPAERLWRPDDWRTVKAACDAAVETFPGDVCDCGFHIDRTEDARAYTLGRYRYGEHQAARDQDKGRVEWLWRCPNCLRKGYTVSEFDLPAYSGEPVEQYDGPLTVPRR